MAIIEAYQCEVTGKKFFIKEEYECHVRVIKNKQKALSYTKMPKHLIEQKFYEMRETCGTTEELNQWISEHLWVFDAARYTHPRYKADKTVTLDDIKGSCIIERLVIKQLLLDKEIPRFNFRNRHSVSNSFSNDGTVDTCQTGFTGRVELTLKNFNGRPQSNPLFLSDCISQQSGLYTGSGGGGGYFASYSVHLLSDEWPRFAENAIYEKLSSD